MPPSGPLFVAWLPLVGGAWQDFQALVPTTVGLIITGLTLMLLAMPRKQMRALAEGSPAPVLLGGPGQKVAASACIKAVDLAQPSVLGTLVPSTGLVLTNPSEPYTFDNPHCEGRCLMYV